MKILSLISNVFSHLSSPFTYVGLLSTVLISLTVLRAPQNLVSFFQLSPIYDQIAPWAGLTLLASSSILVSLGTVEVIKKVGAKLIGRYRDWKEKRELRRKIDTLSLRQQKILARFSANDTNSIQFLSRSVRKVESLGPKSQEFLAELDDMVSKGFLNSAYPIGAYSIKPRVKEFIEEDVTVLEKANEYYLEKRKEKAKKEDDND